MGRDELCPDILHLSQFHHKGVSWHSISNFNYFGHFGREGIEVDDEIDAILYKCAILTWFDIILLCLTESAVGKRSNNHENSWRGSGLKDGESKTLDTVICGSLLDPFEDVFDKICNDFCMC